MTEMRTETRARWVPKAIVALAAGLCGAGIPWWMGSTLSGVAPAGASTKTNVYFDQNEETDFWQTGSPVFGIGAERLPAQDQLVEPWDTNGQLCLFPDGSGRFTIGYNPTQANQTSDTSNIPGSNGGAALAHKQPPVGEDIYNADGSYSANGTTNSDGLNTTNNLHVPGPYRLDPTSSEWNPAAGVVGPGVTSNGLNGGSLGLGGDIPPDTKTIVNGESGPFNNNGTFTGCTFDHNGDLLAVDLGTSQGNYPTADNGRLIEWFKDSGYVGVCIIYGPNSGGDTWASADAQGFTSHHVDGHGGLQQPGLLAADPTSNSIYVPVDATGEFVSGASANDPTGLNGYNPKGKVLKFSNLPITESQCPTAGPADSAANLQYANGDQKSYHIGEFTDFGVMSTFIDGASVGLPFPGSIANDPACNCWALDNIFFGPIAVEFFDRSGNVLASPAPIPANYAPPSTASLPGETTVQGDGLPHPFVPAGTYNPFGMSFNSDGDLFLVDIGVAVDPVGSVESQGLGAGPVNNAGRLLEFNFTNGIAGPPTVIAEGTDFPVSVTTCESSSHAKCPKPTGP